MTTYIWQLSWMRSRGAWQVSIQRTTDIGAGTDGIDLFTGVPSTTSGLERRRMMRQPEEDSVNDPDGASEAPFRKGVLDDLG
jgi:hypothetical protein